MQWIVTPADAGERLDAFLKRQMPARSRAFLQSIIRRGRVQVNGAAHMPAYRLKVEDRVEAADTSPDDEKQKDIQPEPDLPVRICETREDFIIIDKPAGMSTHPVNAEGRGTAANWLVGRFPEARAVGDDALRPGIVHRLDRYTSGVMVVARTQEMFAHLKDCFKGHQVKKEYVAIVEGVPQKREGVVEGHVVPSAKRYDRRVLRLLPVSRSAKISRSRYVVERRIGERASMVRFFPETGRTHQIRLHAKALKTPIIGDVAYGARIALPAELGGRFYLHAERLAFPLQDGSMAEFYVPPSNDFAEVAKWLEKRGVSGEN
ncbi:MAG: RluA family pseudouridine synthase [bacterium]|nr:RluA family pseudouridine synthase [bacterium]